MGATLIELLVAMVILVVLASIAYPSYSAMLIRARRSEGQLALMQAMQRQERYFTEHNRFAEFSPEQANPEFTWWSGSRPVSSAYALTARACSGQEVDQCIELLAVPGADVVDPTFHDEACGTLSLNSRGERGASGAGGPCWP
jgi:type IV pilus assembly protein PilE